MCLNPQHQTLKKSNQFLDMYLLETLHLVNIVVVQLKIRLNSTMIMNSHLTLITEMHYL